MATIALVAGPGYGHLVPIRRLGRALAAHGHRVLEFTDHGLVRPPDDLSQPPPGGWLMYAPPMPGWTALAAYLAQQSVNYLPALIEALHREAVDLVVHDVVAPWGRLGAEWHGLPRVASWPVFPFMWSRQLSPLMADFDGAAEQLHRCADLLGATWGVNLVRGVEMMSENTGDLTFGYTTPEILGPGELDESWRLIGPMMEEPRGADEPALADWNDDPLVYMARGTFLDGGQDLYRAALDGLADLPVRVLIATWDRVAESELAPLPANARVAGRVDSRATLREATLHITHCGSGSVHESLYAGVPMLCAPEIPDQLHWATRVVELGAGELLRERTTEAIRDWVLRMLADRAAFERAGAVGDGLRRFDGARVAVEGVDGLLG